MSHEQKSSLEDLPTPWRRHAKRLYAQLQQYQDNAARAWAMGRIDLAERFDGFADAVAEELEAYLAEAVEAVGETPVTGGSEERLGFTPNVAEVLAGLYAEWLRDEAAARRGQWVARDWEALGSLAGLLRHQLEPLGLLSNVTDEELVEAAQDAFEYYSQVRARHVEARRNPHPSAVDPHELAMGIQEEYEHTDDPRIAQRIALDHLGEDPQYYTKLKRCFE